MTTKTPHNSRVGLRLPLDLRARVYKYQVGENHKNISETLRVLVELALEKKGL
jgi:hypothetical protein